LSLEGFINDIPLVDIHTHIDPKNPVARDPSQIMLYHYIATEIRSIGIPVNEIRAKSADPVGDLIKHFRLIRNTTTYWCLKRILNDLYDFHEEPEPSNWPKLKEAIVERASKPNWARKILEKILLEKIFLTVNPLAEFKPEFDRSIYVASMRLDPLVGGISLDSVRKLEKVSGGSAQTFEGFRDLLAERLKAFSTSAVSVAVSLQSSEIYRPVYKGLGDEAYVKMYAGKPLSGAERVHLRSAALSAVLDLCREYNLPIQIMIGVARDLPGASPPDSAVCFRQKGLEHLCFFFHQYSDVDFHLISAYRFQSHELTVIAKNYPNVYLDGYWWYCFFPESIMQHMLERIQLLPMGKICGFFSDAYVLEWIYGKSALARKITAEALNYMVEKDLYTVEVAKEVAERILSKNAKTLFKI